MTQRIACADGAHRERAVAAARAALRRGDLVVLPTESSYALAADAFSAAGVARLREAKDLDGRSAPAILVPSAVTVTGLAARVSDAARALMSAFWPGGLTLLMPASPTLSWTLPPQAPVAVRQPLHPLTLAVLAATGPLAVSTATRGGAAVPTSLDGALECVGEWTSLALDTGDVPEPDAPPSTIVDVTTDTPVIVRAGAVSEHQVQVVLEAIQVAPAPGASQTDGQGARPVE